MAGTRAADFTDYVLDMQLRRKIKVCRCVCCSVLQCVAVCCTVLHCVALCCSVLQCVAVCCSVLQCVAVDLTDYVLNMQLRQKVFAAVCCSEL